MLLIWGAIGGGMKLYAPVPGAGALPVAFGSCGGAGGRGKGGGMVTPGGRGGGIGGGPGGSVPWF